MPAPMLLSFLMGCSELAPLPPEEVWDLENPVDEPVREGGRYPVSGSLSGTPLGECTLWACGDVYEIGDADFAIEVSSDPCRLDVDCRDDGRIGKGSNVYVTRSSAVGLALRYPTPDEMRVFAERDERELQAVADLSRRASNDVTRSEERRAELARHADHVELQIRRARERRARGESTR